MQASSFQFILFLMLMLFLVLAWQLRSGIRQLKHLK